MHKVAPNLLNLPGSFSFPFFLFPPECAYITLDMSGKETLPGIIMSVITSNNLESDCSVSFVVEKAS